MLFFMYFLQIYRKPSEVEITREGFVLKFRHSKPIFVRYSEVKWITSLKKGDVGCGTIGVIGKGAQLAAVPIDAAYDSVFGSGQKWGVMGQTIDDLARQTGLQISPDWIAPPGVQW